MDDVTNDVRDCPGDGPLYVLVYVALEAGLVTQSEVSLFCPHQKWTFHLFLHFDFVDFQQLQGGLLALFDSLRQLDEDC